LSREYSVVDLFGAPGGLSLGFKMSGYFKILACVDNDPVAAATYAYNLNEAKVITSEIQKAYAFLYEIKKNWGEIDVVMGGPPCPGFSVVGRVKIASLARTGKWNHLKNTHPKFIDDPRNDLYKYFVRVVKKLRPKFFVMENVFGMVSHGGGETVKRVLKDFARIGYATEWRVLNAANYGVPQKRKRIFFVGNRLGLPNPFPAPTHSLSAENSDEGSGLKKTPTVWDAIGDLPRLHAGEGEEMAPYDRNPFTDYQRWARSGSRYVFNHVARPHSERDLRLFRHMREGMRWAELPLRLRMMYGYRDDVFRDRMKRLHRNKPAWTITAHLAKDGYAYIHPTQDRTITVREAARLQSFPDTFIFYGPLTAQFKQVGNAVPPLLAMAVGNEIGKVLESIT
jgi:DNA (cytosine-5)-methyltransferase 1